MNTSKVKLDVKFSDGFVYSMTMSPALAVQLYPEEAIELSRALQEELAKSAEKMKKKYRPKLRRCPQCGGKAHYTTVIQTEPWIHPIRFWDVECKRCGKANAAQFETPAEAANEWNVGPCPPGD